MSWLRYALIGLFIILGIQLLYPQKYTLPFASVAGIPVGLKNMSAAAQVLDKVYGSAQLEVTAGTKQYSLAAHDAGLSLAIQSTLAHARDYVWWQRLIPGSIFFHMIDHQVRPVSLIETAKLQKFANKVSTENDVKPVNATMAFQDDAVKVINEKSGKSYAPYQTVQVLKSALLKPETQVKLSPITQSPARDAKALQPLLETAKTTINTSLTLKIGGSEVAVDKAEIASWLDFVDDPKTNKLSLTLQNDKVRAFLTAHKSAVYQPAGKTTIATQDGIEVGRSPGAPGQDIDYGKAVTAISNALLNGHDPSVAVAIPTAAIAPTVSYARSYTGTEAGLQALLNDIAAEKGGYGISVIELGGMGRVASANGDKKFVTASTYKLFVAYSLLKQIDAGSWKWSDMTDSGKSTTDCFELMIVHSDNACAESFGGKLGWTNIQNQMRGLSLANTTFSSDNDTSTANDEALYLQKLEQKTIGLSDDSRAKLLDVMKRQVYRSGIPAGVSGTVADKVGFLDGYLNDAAIVYDQDETYILVIMSQGSSWGSIADAAQRIDTFLNQ